MAQAVQNVTMPDRASATDALIDLGKTSLDTPGTTAVNIEGMGQIGKAPESTQGVRRACGLVGLGKLMEQTELKTGF